MTGQGPRKTVADGHWSGRLTQAREFLEAARSLVVLAESTSYNSAITLMVTAAIAYADSLTAKRKGIVNTQDHAAAPRLLREILGNGLPDRHERFYRRLLGRKDEVNYGARSTSLDDARRVLQELEEFANWVEATL